MSNPPAPHVGDSSQRPPLAHTLTRYARALDESTIAAGARLGGHLAFALPPYVGPELFQGSAVQRLRDMLLESRLLLLHGADGVPSAALAQRVAQAVAVVCGLSAFTVDWPLDDTAILADLPGSSDLPAIFVIEAGPRAMGWASPKLLDALTAKNSYLLLVSAAPEEAWHLARFEQPLWVEQSGSDLFELAYLRQVLHDELLAQAARLPAALRAGLDEAEPSLSGLTLAELARLLGTPLHCVAFARTLAGRDHPGAMAELVAATVRRPFAMLAGAIFHDLSRNERLLGLGLCLQDGLFEAPLFRRLETLFEEVWGERQANGALIDDDDLVGLLPLFAATGSPPRRRFVARYPGLSRQLIANAAPAYGRHLRRAALWLAVEQLPSNTVSGEHAGLRDATIMGLSDAGLADLRLVEEALLLLVAHAVDGRSTLVAQVLSRWYELGAADPLLALLRRWRNDGEVAGAMGKLVERLGGTDGVAPRDRLTAACVLVAAHAAQADRPGQLGPKLLAELRAIGGDAGPLTRQVLREQALPILLPLHLRSLDELLRDLSCYGDLRPAISDQLVAIYRHNRRDVARTFARWLDQAEREAAPYVAGNAATPYDTSLATMALTLGQIDPDLTTPPMLSSTSRLEDLFSQAIPEGEVTLTNSELVLPLMRRLLTLPRHPMVRDAARAMMIRQGRYNDALIDELLVGVGQADSEETVRALTAIYLEERSHLAGGDATINVDGRIYPVFSSGMRPKTGSELAVGRWLAAGAEGQAREIALQASTAFVAALDVHEAKALKEGQITTLTRPSGPTPTPVAPKVEQAAQQPLPTVKPASQKQQASPSAEGFFRTHFVPTFVTLDAPEQRSVIGELLPLAQQLRERTPGAIDFLLKQKWPGYNSPLAETVAERLSAALGLVERGWRGLQIADLGRTLRTFYTLAQERNMLWLGALFVVIPALIGLMAVVSLVLR